MVKWISLSDNANTFTDFTFFALSSRVTSLTLTKIFVVCESIQACCVVMARVTRARVLMEKGIKSKCKHPHWCCSHLTYFYSIQEKNISPLCLCKRSLLAVWDLQDVLCRQNHLVRRPFLPMVGGPRLNETQWLSNVHKFLHDACIPMERFFITWPSSAKHWTGVVYLICRHKSEERRYKWILGNCLTTVRTFVEIFVCRLPAFKELIPSCMYSLYLIRNKESN